MFSGSEDGTVKIWDIRAPGCQRHYESRGPINTVALHPNQVRLHVAYLLVNGCYGVMWLHANKSC